MRWRRCKPEMTLTEMRDDAEHSAREARKIAADAEPQLSEMEQRRDQNHVYEAVLSMIKHRPQGGSA